MMDSHYLLDQIESLFVPLWTTRNKETINIYQFNHYKNNRNWQISTRIETFFPERGSSVSRNRRIARVGKKKAKKMSVNKRVYFTVKRSRKGPPSDSFTYLSFHALRVPPFPPFHSSHLFQNTLFIHIYITMTNRELLQKINELLLPLPRPH